MKCETQEHSLPPCTIQTIMSSKCRQQDWWPKDSMIQVSVGATTLTNCPTFDAPYMPPYKGGGYVLMVIQKVVSYKWLTSRTWSRCFLAVLFFVAHIYHFCIAHLLRGVDNEMGCSSRYDYFMVEGNGSGDEMDLDFSHAVVFDSAIMKNIAIVRRTRSVHGKVMVAYPHNKKSVNFQPWNLWFKTA